MQNTVKYSGHSVRQYATGYATQARGAGQSADERANADRAEKVGKLNKAHTAIRADHARDVMPSVFMYLASRDIRREQQRDERRAKRALR